MEKIITVVIGLVFNSQQEILLAWRDATKTPGDCWEFPGGKVEAGETRYQALGRELAEEIGIAVQSARELPSICHRYDQAQVILHPWIVEKYEGIPQGVEGQQLAWTPLSQLRAQTLPSANYAIVDFLLLHYEQRCAVPLSG